jgi:sugar transferase (PEP-CTERM/EpsH1 system associated)
MQNAVRQEIESVRFDLLFAYSSSMAPYIAQTPKVPKVLDFVDSDASKWRQYAAFKPAVSRWLFAYESSRLADFEKSMVKAFDCSVFVSPREARFLENPEGKIAFIQNGIDIDPYVSPPGTNSPPNLIFVGAMDYFPNVDAVCFFAREIMPRIRERRDMRFLIVGSHPVPSVRRLARLPGITVTGDVDDVRPYLQRSSVAVVPNRIAQGIQNKILEALAAGLPVVATTAAAQGLTSIEGLPIAVADDPGDFADSILRFLDKPPDAEELRICHGRLKRQYSWEMNLSLFDRLFEQLVSNAGIVESKT